MYATSVNNIIRFLTELFYDGAQYGTLNSCRSALSLILGSQVTDNDSVKRFFKGIGRLRPPLPKYNVTWNTSIVLNVIQNWFPNETLSLEILTKKLITLLALVTAHRVQTFSKINIENIEISSDSIKIKIPDQIKTSRVGSLQPILALPFYQIKPEICPGKTLLAYLEITKSLRKNHKGLFISFKKPHNVVTSQTLSRWIKNTLKECGIDVEMFSAHSTRHAATSQAHKLGISLDMIRQTAGWSGISNTFGRFYNREIPETTNSESFGITILNNSLSNDNND